VTQWKVRYTCHKLEYPFPLGPVCAKHLVQGAVIYVYGELWLPAEVLIYVYGSKAGDLS
jgi:hypothetical protein